MKIKTNLLKIPLFLTISIVLTGCATQSTSTIVGGEYSETKNITDYFVLPYGSVSLPGKWEKTSYNEISKQQFFRNQDSIKIALAFERYNSYQFNTDGTHTGFSFVRAYYEWDSKYFMDSFGLNRQTIESDSAANFMIYRIYGQAGQGEFDTYFLIGEKNGNISNFSISITHKWNEGEKVKFLKSLYLIAKNE